MILSNRLDFNIFIYTLIAILLTGVTTVLWIIFFMSIIKNRKYLDKLLDIFNVSKNEEDFEEEPTRTQEVSSPS